MHDVLNRNLYLVKEHVGMFKAANNFDIYDPETGELILECREEKARYHYQNVAVIYGIQTDDPFDIEVREPSGKPIVRIHRGTALFLSRVMVSGENDELIGGFKQKMFSIGGAFTVLDADDNPLCELKGKWTGWNFHFKKGDVDLAHVSKKWAGIGKEFFTSADNYILEISDQVPNNSRLRQLILAAVMCIDMCLKSDGKVNIEARAA